MTEKNTPQSLEIALEALNSISVITLPTMSKVLNAEMGYEESFKKLAEAKWLAQQALSEIQKIEEE